MADFALMEGLKRRWGDTLVEDESDWHLNFHPIVLDPTNNGQHCYAIPKLVFCSNHSVSLIPVDTFLQQLCNEIESGCTTKRESFYSKIERVVIKWDGIRGSSTNSQRRLLASLGKLPSLKALFIGGRTEKASSLCSGMPLPIPALSLEPLIRNSRLVDLHIRSQRIVVFDSTDEVQSMADALQSNESLISVSLGSLSLNLPATEKEAIANQQIHNFLDPLVRALATIPTLRDVTLQGPPLLMTRRLPSCVSPTAIVDLLPRVQSLTLRRVRLNSEHASVIANFLQTKHHDDLQNLDLLGNFVRPETPSDEASTRPHTAIAAILMDAVEKNQSLLEFKLDGLYQVQREKRDSILCLNRAGRKFHRDSLEKWIQYISGLSQHDDSFMCSVCLGPCVLSKQNTLLSSIFEAVRGSPHHFVVSAKKENAISKEKPPASKFFPLREGYSMPPPITLQGALQQHLEKQQRWTTLPKKLKNCDFTLPYL